MSTQTSTPVDFQEKVRLLSVNKFLLACVLSFITTTLPGRLSGQALSEPTVQLTGHVLEVLPTANRLPKSTASANEPVTLTIMLQWSDPSGFDSYAKGFEDRKSPNYRHTLSHEEFMARFGPTQQAYDAVLAFLRQNGFTLLNGSANRLTLTVRGTRAQAEHAFGASIDDYQLGSRTFHANSTEPAIPKSLASVIRSVSGLSNLAQPHRNGSPNPSNATSFAAAYNGTLTPTDTFGGNSGGLPPGINGAGQTIGLIEFDNYNAPDLINTLIASGLPVSLSNQVSQFNINGGTIATPNNTIEVLGDIVSALGAAPGANIIVFDSYNENATQIDMVNSAFNQIRTVPGGTGGVISDSWALCEYVVSNSDADSMETLLQAFKIYGVSFFVASGDFGANCVDTTQSPRVVYPNRINFPSDAPDAVAVGGTTLQVGAGNSYQSEAWWNDTNGAGGFGSSWHFGRPSYQNAYTNSPNRSVPDVSADAGDSILVCVGSTPCSGNVGTSFAAPFWAGVWALACQAKGGSCPSANGGYLYTALHATDFHPASTMTGIGNDFTHVGLGSPNITNLVAQVAGPASITSISPISGPITGSTTVIISGSNFIGVSGVLFGGTPAPSYSIDSISQITAVTPPCPVSSSCWQNSGSGGAQITVITPVGQSFSPPQVDFEYGAVIYQVSPNSGAMEGRTVVTVTGVGFGLGRVNGFSFGGIPAVGAYCNSTTQCVMGSPTSPTPGIVDVTYGISPTSAADRFAYEGPMVTSVDPPYGSQLGGDNVTVTGTSFASGMTIKFGNTQITNFSCSGDTCFVSTPPGTGSVHVTVSVNGRTSPATSADYFNYEPLPYGSLSPSSGPGTGGTLLMVNGGNFSTTPGATTFTFNFGFGAASNATNVSCTTANVCTMLSPPFNSQGSGPIALVKATVTRTCRNGGKAAICVGNYSLTGAIADFTYTSGAYPTGSVSPNWGSPAGGTTVTVTGSQLTSPLGPTTFTFKFAGSGGSAPATHVICSSSTLCTMKSPALSASASGHPADVMASVNGYANSVGTFTYGSAAPPPPPPPPPPKPVPPPKCHGLCQ
jgi:hypothetical protein